MFGYPTIDDYYADASPCRRLKRIGIPILCLNSMDDVFSPNHGKLIHFVFLIIKCSLLTMQNGNSVIICFWHPIR